MGTGPDLNRKYSIPASPCRRDEFPLLQFALACPQSDLIGNLLEFTLELLKFLLYREQRGVIMLLPIFGAIWLRSAWIGAIWRI
jgi:hypothetical protein